MACEMGMLSDVSWRSLRLTATHMSTFVWLEVDL